MAKVKQIRLLDDTIQANSIAYKDENTLLYLTGNSLYSYDLITKVSTLVYNFSYSVTGLAYKDNYVYFSYTSGERRLICSMSLDDFTITTVTSMGGGDYCSYTTLIFNGYDGEPYACLFGYYYYSGSYPSSTARNYYSNIRYQLTPTSATIIVSASTSYNPKKTTLTWAYPFMYNIFTSSKFFAYGYRNYSGGSSTTYYKMGYVSPPSSTISLSVDTALEKVLVWGYEDEENIYILSSESLNKINKTSLVESTVLINDLGVSGTFYSYGSKGIYFLSSKNLYVIEDVEYNLTYEIKSIDGSTTYATHTNSAPITKTLFGFDGTTVSYILTTLAGNITGQYTPEVIEGKQLIGYGSSPNSKKTAITVNRETDVTIRNDFTFYEVYATYRPPETTFQLNLYQNSAEPNRVDKTDYLTDVGSLLGAFREESSLVNMNVIIQQVTVPSFNYVYIPILNRYYYVTDISSVRYGLWRITLEVDVLMSYKDAIRQCIGFCERNEFQFDDNIIDRNRVIEQGADVTVTPVTNELFIDSGGSVVVQGFGLKSYTVE